MRHRIVWCLIAVLGCLAGAAPAAGPGDLDWDAWERMPVLHRGRIKPLDTFARAVVQSISNRESPLLSPPPDGPAPELAEARKLFPDGRPRKFAASELVFSWMVEPEAWERVPFLAASHEDLRRDLLGLPLTDARGNRLRFASPHDVASAVRLRERLESLEEAQRKAAGEGRELEPVGLDKRASDLWEAYSLFRAVSFHPLAPSSEKTRFVQQMNEATRTWNEIAKTWHGRGDDDAPQPGLETVLQQLGWLDRKADHVQATEQAFDRLFEVLGSRAKRRMDVATDEAAPRVAELRKAAGDMARQLAAYLQRLEERRSELGKEQYEFLYVKLRGAASRAADLAQLAREAHLALYDNGNSLAIIPALNPAALERNRDSAEDARRRLGGHAVILAQPWIGLHAVILGSDDLMRDYPRPELDAVREAFAAVKAAYVDRQNPERKARFSEAMQRYVAAVRTLGEKTADLRTEILTIRDPDEEMIAATAYPAADATGTEVLYNRLDPFTWSWTLNLLGVALFALGFGPLRRAMFWLGLAAVAAGQAMTVAGLGLRVAITGRAPVATMFETVVFVALVVALLGLWFTLAPLFVRGLQLGWRMAAIPWTPEAVPLTDEQRAMFSPRAWSMSNWTLLLPRLALSVLVFVALAKFDSSAGDYGSGYIALLPRATDNWSALTTWLVGLGVLGLSVYYVPRAVLALTLSLATVPYHLARAGLREPTEQVFARKPFAVAGASVAFLAAFLACYVPTVDQNVFDKQMNPLMAALRDNFWLTSHVLSITASYGAGALAWGLGNLALTWYLFGRYRDTAATATAALQGNERATGPAGVACGAVLARCPPEVCASLGTYIYKAMQVAVLLLAIGTILGAVWADEAWGRFWGWDPKEVWALISLLVYLAVLHGRYVGWIGHFGLAFGSVLGAASIVMAWYGVNFILRTGLHSYGSGGDSGKWWVVLAMVLNVIYALAALGRYLIETRLFDPKR
ncbi:MAG: cytochrome c biogenesis protein CcsA [Thermoguttaceae bacterium]|jgi:ABC-type transport system involved in cytochrome c biogenesis permease subunit|nr:cytochrome c biogenesis protein CcsA [Thermoguttaceae bacterium]